MGYFAQGTSARAQGSTPSSSTGILLTAPGGLNSKGNYIDIINPTDQHATWMVVEMLPAGVVAQQALVDIAYTVGGGSEHIVIENLGVNSGSGPGLHSVAMPCSVPAGAVVRARYQRTSASLTIRVAVKLFSTQGLAGRHKITTYGAVTGDSGGTSVDPGGSANTKGTAWSELTAATTAPINWMLIHIGNQANSARTGDINYLFDISLGAAAAEVAAIVVPNLGFSMDDVPDEPYPPYIGPFPLSVPVGSRLSVRGQCGTTDATDRLFDIIAYGIS